MLKDDSLYKKLSLDDFASFEQIEERWRKYCEWKAISSTNVSDSKIEEAFKILRDLETKQLYDILLDASNRPQMMLPRFNSPDDVLAIQELASRLGIQLRQVSKLTYQIVRPTSQLETEMVGLPRFTVPVGGAFIAFSAIPFSTEWDRLNDQVILVLESEQDYAFAASSGFGKVNIGYGDRGLAIRAGLPNEASRLNTAYINQTRGSFGLFDTASNAFFPSDSLYIAQRFGVRNSPVRIRQTMLQFYDGLAESLARFDDRISLESSKAAFRRSAKRYHPQFS